MRQTKFLIPCVLAVLLLAGCGGAAAPAEVVDLRLGVDTGMSPPIIQVLGEAVTDWNAAQPEIQITLEAVPEYWVKIPSAFAAGTAPDILYDTVTETTSTFAELGMYLSLDDYITNSEAISPDDLYEGVWATSSWMGHTWVLPYNWNDLGVVYNKDMFDQAGVPYPTAGWTWDEFLSTAKALTLDTNGDGTLDQFGFYADSWPFYGVFPFIWSNGGELLSADKSEAIGDGPEAMEAVTFYVDLVRKEHVAPTGPELGENPDPFATGLVAMQLVRSWAPATYKEIAPNLNYGVTSIPMKVARINYFEGSGFGINSKSAYPDQAWQFLEFLMSDGHQMKMAELQVYFPGSKSVLESVSWNEPMQGFLAEAQYGRDVMVVSQWETLTSNWFFWLGTALGGVDPIDLPADVAAIQDSCTAELAKHPNK